MALCSYGQDGSRLSGVTACLSPAANSFSLFDKSQPQIDPFYGFTVCVHTTLNHLLPPVMLFYVFVAAETCQPGEPDRGVPAQEEASPGV